MIREGENDSNARKGNVNEREQRLLVVGGYEYNDEQ